MTFSHGRHLSPPLYLPHTHHRHSNRRRQALPDILSVVEGASRVLTAHTQPSDIYHTSSPSPLTPISHVLAANSKTLDIYDTSHLVHVSHAREVTSSHIAMGTEGTTSHVVLDSHTEPIDIYDVSPLLPPPPHISHAPRVAVGMVERVTGGRRTVSVTSGREMKLREIKEVSLELSESSYTENEVRRSKFISEAEAKKLAARNIGSSRESVASDTRSSRELEAKEIASRELNIGENGPRDVLRRKIGQRELGVRKILKNVGVREREVKDTNLEKREIGLRETRIREVGLKESHFVDRRKPSVEVREDIDYIDNSSVLGSRWQGVDDSNEKILQKNYKKERYKAEDHTSEKIGGQRDDFSRERTRRRVEGSSTERVNSQGKSISRERRGVQKEMDTATEKIGRIEGEDYSAADWVRRRRGEEKSNGRIKKGGDGPMERKEGRRDAHFSERLGRQSERIGEQRGNTEGMGGWREEEHFGDRIGHKAWTRTEDVREGRSKTREDKAGSGRRRRWGEDVGGGEEEHRFCCAVARMRLIIHLQTLLREQFESLQDELERRREECIQLRTVLANRAHDMRALTQTSYGKDVDIVNEDGELAVAYQTQKQVNRQLEDELKLGKHQYREMEVEYKGELERLRRDNERQQKLLAQNLTKGDLSSSNPEALLQSEIMRLTSENLNLQGQVDTLTEQLKKYKRSLRVYAKKLKEAGGGDPPDLLEVGGGTVESGEVIPIIRKKERDYMGMFEYDRRDEIQIIKVLIYELKPRVGVTLLPGLPAYILFMCIRHTDHINDDEKVRSLLNNIVNGVKRVIKKRHEDLDSTVLWLSNVLRLLHNLKQYSGDKAFQPENTVKQNEQALKNFDLSEYRQVLSDIAVWIYNGVIKLMEEKVQPLIVPSILEHEAIAGLSGNKPGGMRGRAGSLAREPESPVEPQKALDLLLKEMTQFYRTLAMFGTDPELITQVFRQIFYFICAGSLNNLLLRKDMCHWSKGMQIRYNLSHLEQWTRDMRLHEAGVTDTLAPIIQAAQLLQARKTDDDVHSICDMCDKLSVSQIIKILNLYTPADEFEERVPITFIHKIQAKLQERAEGEQAQATLLMNTKFAFPVRFPFNPSTIHLEDIELPDALPLSMLKKV
ncbi:hypothetical protein Pmani_029590 [Petrolisthes manimaculis]|uniref:Dilute domain-containing protein n=1 Tax=Petrolisthes manimaculis TaxID=1843537 RepID=A0AAE1NYE6_9EUCA|nr:hypothetical protein Pmani_029590 [Petrolisthes manimaculis]